MEGRVFPCTWQRTGARYRVWVRNRPALSAEDDVFDAADEALADAICGATGDGESMREYDPPRPREERSGLLFQLAVISGQRRGFIENAAELFNEDYCPQCKHPRGNRTAAPLRLARIEPGQGGGYAMMERPHLHGGPLMSFFPEGFVACLRPDERSQFQWRPVHAPKRIKKRFVELVNAKVHVPRVSLSGVAATLWNRPSIVQKEHTLSRCDTCGRTQQRIYWYRMSSLPPYYVNIADLPDPLPTCIGVGNPEYPSLCLTRERWSELVKLPESRGMTSTDVGVVAPGLVDPMPAVRSLAEITKQYSPGSP